MALARPAANVMRRSLQADLKKHVIIAGALSTVVALSYKFLINDWRKAKYQEFYKFVLQNFFPPILSRNHIRVKLVRLLFVIETMTKSVTSNVWPQPAYSLQCSLTLKHHNGSKTTKVKWIKLLPLSKNELP